MSEDILNLVSDTMKSNCNLIYRCKIRVNFSSLSAKIKNVNIAIPTESNFHTYVC